MADIIITPVNIADKVFQAALKERLEVVEENEKRAKLFKDPLSIPPWDVKNMIENIRIYTLRFREHAKQFPYNRSSDIDEWVEIAIKRLRDDYLIPIASEDDDVLRQLCEIWPELTPPPALTEQQRKELADLQKQADAIMEKITVFLKDGTAEMKKLSDREAEIVRGTQTPNDKRIGKLTELLEIIMPERYIKIFNFFPRW